MRKPRLLPIAVLTAAMGLTALHALATERVYKWVDAEGVVHYGQQPPAHTPAEAIKVEKGYSTTEAAPVPEPTAEQQQQAADAETCRVASENFKMLSGEGPVKKKDEYGNEHTLTPDEKNAEKLRAQSAMEKFCAPGTATQPAASAP